MERYRSDDHRQASPVSAKENTTVKKESGNASSQEVPGTGAVYRNIAKALVQDYFNLYYVDVVTEEFIKFGPGNEESETETGKAGSNFFTECRKNAKRLIFEEDQDRVIKALDKKNLLSEIKKNGMFVFQYRLMVAGAPVYVVLKATRIAGDDRHIIISVTNVDKQVKISMALERQEEEKKLYMRFRALNGNLVVLYFVDPETERYTELHPSVEDEDLGIARQGTDFFGTVCENRFRTVHPEDLALFRTQVTKENVLAAIERDGIFLLDYRLMSDTLPTYVRLKATKIEEDGKPLLIIGLLDEDAQMRQEREYARDLAVAKKMATVDSLTGVKNKHAYEEYEYKINAAVKTGTQEPFAVVVCDINDLKPVNDLYGHKEGDACIRKACAKICSVFRHSPVFRIGGDEFAVILTGADYEYRARLMEEINKLPSDRSKIRLGETISVGMTEYNKDRHHSFQDVFEEADKAMYERKQFLKGSYLAKEDPDETGPESEEIPVINTRKQILIVDDMETSREILGALLEDEYDILYAADGAEALKILCSCKGEINLVLLDLLMPNMNGREVIAQMQIDEELMSVPVIFLTSDSASEVDCLKIGAADFISKPLPDVEIVKARIEKCIELSEDRDLIQHTERDRLTGLLNKDFFLRYVKRLDRIYRETVMDAVVFDINRFHLINKNFGRQFGDKVLSRIGTSIRKLARKTDGISCRQGADTFLLYCPHQDDHELLLRGFLADIFADKDIADKVTLRAGVFADARQEADIEERFNRAVIAADRVKDDQQKICGYYYDII